MGFNHGLLNSCKHCRGMENIFSFDGEISTGIRGVIRGAVSREFRFFLRNNNTMPKCFTKDGIDLETLKILGDLGVKFAPK